MATSIPPHLLHAGHVAKTSYATFTGVATTTGVIPYDDSIPQNTEGGEFMTISHTPTKVGNIMVVEAYANFNCGNDGNSGPPTGALFKDSDANAFAASQGQTPFGGAASQINTIFVVGYVTAASLSSITFRFRAGGTTGATHTFNGSSSARRYGGVSASYMRVTEISV